MHEWLAKKEGLHRGRLMLLAGSGFRAGAQRRGNLQASLSRAGVAAHRAVEADQRERSVGSPHCWIAVPLAELAWRIWVGGGDAAVHGPARRDSRRLGCVLAAVRFAFPTAVFMIKRFGSDLQGPEGVLDEVDGVLRVEGLGAEIVKGLGVAVHLGFGVDEEDPGLVLQVDDV